MSEPNRSLVKRARQSPPSRSRSKGEPTRSSESALDATTLVANRLLDTRTISRSKRALAAALPVLQRSAGNRVAARIGRQQPAPAVQRQLGAKAEVGDVVVKNDWSKFTVVQKYYDKELSQLVYEVQPKRGKPFIVPDSNRLYHRPPEIDPELPPKIRELFWPGMTVDQADRALQSVRSMDVKFEVGVAFEDGELRRVVSGSSADGKVGTHATVSVPILLNADGNHGDIKVTASGSVMTHSHPTGLPLSDGDVATAARHNFLEVRAVGLTTFSLRRSGDNWVDSTDNLAMFEVFGLFRDVRPKWKDACEKALGLKLVKGKLVGTEIKIGADWLDLADASKTDFAKAMDHYWSWQVVAKKKGWHMDDGFANNLRAYARLALEHYLGVKDPATYIPQ